ncbi:hypothetical protein [Oxalobacter formigenes]|uniref:hypothetical protein n=1 Tax=Oxalobacter formigenes TaxID=847 RepID=UPI000A29F735|nr:hypothetical protein [Oxalobacter formigenes]ARQ46074.1 hypothetical protein BRW83_1331 [Oxalobacter formigenes]QDX33189.1 hypothetical protein FPZ51_06130 [Oxalobacter formigenes]
MKEHVTVIPEDKIIIVDSLPLQCEFDTHIAGLHALQWHNGKGELEIVSDDGKISNHEISSYTSEVNSYVEIWQAKYDEINAPYVPTFEEAKAAKLAEINAACDSILNAATATYPASEVLTFDQQVREAQTYQTDNATSVPLLSALATSRKITLPELVQRILVKHDAFSALSGSIIGQRQALEDVLDTLTTVESVQALIINIQIPESVA